MKPKKTLKFSKETIILLDKSAKKTIKGGNIPTLECPSFECPTLGCSLLGSEYDCEFRITKKAC